MSADTADALHWICFGGVLVWFALVSFAFRRLRLDHPEVYEGLGSPSLVWNNTIRNGWLLAKYLIRGGWRELKDPSLERLFAFMRVYLILWFALFAYYLFRFFRVFR